jgi:hypothetical protein
MLRNDYTVPTRCRLRGGILDPLGCKACRAIRQPISPSNQPIQSDTGSLDPKPSKTSQFSGIRRFIGIVSHASESYYYSYTVATSGDNRRVSQICHNRLFRKKLQQNILPVISTEISTLAAHNKWKGPRHVASVESDYVFVVENLLTKEHKAAYATRLRFYKDKDLNVTADWPRPPSTTTISSTSCRKFSTRATMNKKCFTSCWSLGAVFLLERPIGNLTQ